MAKTLAQIQQQIEKLQKAADAIKAKELPKRAPARECVYP